MIERTLYNRILSPASRVAIPVAAKVSSKVRRGLDARQGVLDRWRKIAAVERRGGPVVWLHASSAGEALQARPLAEEIRRDHPDATLFLSYFSPSAERFVRGWGCLDGADVLPFDRPNDIAPLVEMLDVDTLVLVSGETWPNLVWEASGADVGIAQASCKIAGSARLRWPVRRLTAAVYEALDAVAAVEDEDGAALRSLGVEDEAIRVAGDTRADVTVARARAAANEPQVWRRPDTADPVIVAGSTWPADEAVLLPAIAALRWNYPAVVALVAPHEPTPDAVERITAAAAANGLDAAPLEEASGGTSVVIVDRIGVLYRLYATGDMAYVGGGFSGSVHNILEPTAHAVPIAIGPNHGNPRGLRRLTESGGLAVVRSTEELSSLWDRYAGDPGARATAGKTAAEALDRMTGATETTLSFFRERGLSV